MKSCKEPPACDHITRQNSTDKALEVDFGIDICQKFWSI